MVWVSQNCLVIHYFTHLCKTNTSLDQIKGDKQSKLNFRNVHAGFNSLFREERSKYLASIEMSIDLHDDLVVLIGGLLSGDHHLGCRQVLQLIDLQTSSSYFRSL